MTKLNVTVFKHFSETKKPHVTSVDRVIEKIRTGGDQKVFLESLRGMNKKEYKEKKKELPIICFNGIFTERDKHHLVQSSGVMILDFDGVEDMATLKANIVARPYTLACFISPSGAGYKALIRIPNVDSDEEYKTYFKAMKQEFPDIDDSGKDIARASFFSYDPTLYYNPRATPFNIDRKKLYNVKEWDKVNKVLRKIEDAIEGEKHIVRQKIGYLFGGWVGSDALTFEGAIDLLSQAAAKNTDNYEEAVKNLTQAVHAGMAAPLSLSDENAVLNMKIGVGKKYYHMDDVWEKIEKFRRTGYVRGADTGWKELDEYYSRLLGSTTIIYGSPYSGKSQFHFENLVNEAVNYGHNEAVLSPETGDIEHVYSELISIYIGKPIEDISEEEFNAAAEFIKRHFFVIDTFGDDFNMRDLFVQVEAIEREFDIKIHGVTVDPANYLDPTNPNLRSDLAVGKDMDVFNADARKNHRHNTLITHIRDIETRKRKDSDGNVISEYLPPPRPRDIFNGQQYWRKGMMMIGVYRPQDLDGNPLPNHEHNETNIIISKVKPKGTGTIGTAVLFYDWTKNRYYEKRGDLKIYAKGFVDSERATEGGTTEAPPQEQNNNLKSWESLGDSTEEESPFA